jgi:L-lactate dehydrogenase (cytochrome)
MLTYDQVAQHDKEEDCWVVIHGKVYDLTKFLPDHPGGVKIIAKWAGTDATEAFSMVHNPDVVDMLPEGLCLGEIDPKTKPKPPKNAPQQTVPVVVQVPTNVETLQQQPFIKPDIDHMLNVFDFEAIARRTMTKEGWDYYSSGSDDEITLRENRSAFQRIWLRPRVMINVRQIDLSCKLLGDKSSLPVYISATAMGRLAHPDGEVALTRAAHTTGIIQMCPTLASCSLKEMLDAKQPGQTQWFQLYVNSNRKLTEKVVHQAEQGGCTTLCVTVDAPQLGRRERDMRNKFVAKPPDLQRKQEAKGTATVKRNAGVAQALTSFIDPGLCWDDIEWLKSITKMKLVLKGVQCGEDAVLAFKHGCDGIICSNHGGRQLDFSRSGIEVLIEVMEALDKINARDKIEVFVDGGIRRGTDVFKALALGAKAVGIGRPALWGLGSYGQPGVERVLQILDAELRMCMSLMGCPTIDHIRPDMVITKNISDHMVPVPHDWLAESNYIPSLPAGLPLSKL